MTKLPPYLIAVLVLDVDTGTAGPTDGRRGTNAKTTLSGDLHRSRGGGLWGSGGDRLVSLRA